MKPNVYEAYISGKYARWVSEDAKNYDFSKGLWIQIRTFSNLKGKEKTVLKSVSLVDDVDVPPMPSRLMLAGVKMGTHRYEECYIGDKNEIVWAATGSNEIGWDLTGIDLTETPVVNIELESTDVPVRVYIRQGNTETKAKINCGFKHTGNHSFQIDMSKIEGYNPDRLSKVQAEFKNGGKLDLTKGAVIMIQVVNPISKPGKTTVVRKAELLKEFTK